MEYTKKKADTGMFDFNQHGDSLSPNTDNVVVYYSGDCWSDDRDKDLKEENPVENGAGEYYLDNKNPAVMYGWNFGNSIFDALDKQKLDYRPADQKTFDKRDLNAVNDMCSNELKHVFNVSCNDETNLKKEARIVKTPNKEEYRILSEKGKHLGTYKSRKQAEKRLKQIEMFKHMNKKAEAFDWKGHQRTEEHLGTPEKVVPQRSQDVRPYAIPKIQVTPVNQEGSAQDDSALAVSDIEAEASVVGDVKGKVTQNVTDGSQGFSSTRGGRGARGHFFYYGITKESATRIYQVPLEKLRPQDASRNDQSPQQPFLAAKDPTSYSPQQKEELKKEIINQKPVSTANPSTFLDRLLSPESRQMAEGTGVGTWDFFILPTNQNVEKDCLTSKEKKEEKQNSNNNTY